MHTKDFGTYLERRMASDQEFAKLIGDARREYNADEMKHYSEICAAFWEVEDPAALRAALVELIQTAFGEHTGEELRHQIKLISRMLPAPEPTHAG